MPTGRVIGIDAGGTKLLAGVVDERLLVHHRVHRVIRGLGQRKLLEVMVEVVEEARAAEPDVGAVGFGIPSRVDADLGVSEGSVHLPLDGVPFRALMSERLGLPVAVDNDANAALLAESRAGAARGARCAAMVTLGTGIGGGLLIDGELFRGNYGGGAELGHMIVDIDGPECSCGSRGCLEALASGSAIGRLGEEAARKAPDSALGRALGAREELSGRLVTELAHDGDEMARDVLASVGRSLGAGIANIVNIFEPQVVVVGGGAIAGGELLLEPARKVVASRALYPARDRVRIAAAEFGDEAGMVGAALLAMDVVRTPY
ncbi:MAG TPA: ROK family protein [Thermoleophilaceae bacterium]